MNKILYVSGLTCLVMIFGACGTKTQSPNSNIGGTQEQMEQSDDGTFLGSAKDLLGMGKSQKCIWSENGKVIGTVYMDGDKIRSDAKGVMMGENDQKGNMSMINDGEWIYTWDDMTKQGMKMKSEEEIYIDDIDSEMSDHVTEALDDKSIDMFDEMYEYECEKWKVDANMFVPPSDVQFQDMNAMLDQMQDVAGGMQGMCDLLPADEKDECLAEMQEMQVDMVNVSQ